MMTIIIQPVTGMIRTNFIGEDGEVIYEEFVSDMDAAVAMLPHVWRDRVKPRSPASAPPFPLCPGYAPFFFAGLKFDPGIQE